ncbi:hypothetical protein QAD02_004032 [Eretmocerus hayati]|uniref:Uncharacterized protein n=1 Tax=Eretmocerus hayati TaxID=131215 RepID=A0ACC2NNU2_9HYME|nr:hypothetical protein QAD02_004032 [Eretmocerus hayati]
MGIKMGPIKQLRALIDKLTESSHPNHNAAVILGNQEEQYHNHSGSEAFENENENPSAPDPLQLPRNAAPPLLISIDVRKLVREDDAINIGAVSLEAALDSGIYSVDQRRKLVRIVTDEIIRMCGSLRPPTGLKVIAAQSITTEFPKLATGSEGWRTYYDPVTYKGFIEFRLKTLRKKSKKRKLPCTDDAPGTSDKRPRQTTVETVDNNVESELIDEDEYKEIIADMRALGTTENDKEEILQLMEKSRANRRRDIFSSEERDEPLTLNDILRKFDKFKYFEGQMVIKEFEGLGFCRQPRKFLAKFPSFYVARILKYCEMYKPDLLVQTMDIFDENLRALIILPSLLPSPNFTKKAAGPSKSKKSTTKSTNRECSKLTPPKDAIFSSQKLPNKNLLRFVDASDDLLRDARPSSTQPFLVCACTGQEKRGQFYIKADGHVIPVGRDSLKAFDVLLKLHYCFDICFAPDLVMFYDFLSNIVMEMSEARSYNIDFNTRLNNITNLDLSKIYLPRVTEEEDEEDDEDD